MNETTRIYINQKLIQVSNLNAIFSGANVLHVLPLAHEYQSPLVTKCENFMIAMCRPSTGLTVSIQLISRGQVQFDEILKGCCGILCQN